MGLFNLHRSGNRVRSNDPRRNLDTVLNIGNMLFPRTLFPRRFTIRFCLALLVFLAVSMSFWPYSGDVVRVEVLLDGEPLNMAVVGVLKLGTKAPVIESSTDESGVARFHWLPRGAYVVYVFRRNNAAERRQQRVQRWDDEDERMRRTGLSFSAGLVDDRYATAKRYHDPATSGLSFTVGRLNQRKQLKLVSVRRRRD